MPGGSLLSVASLFSNCQQGTTFVKSPLAHGHTKSISLNSPNKTEYPF